MEKEIKTPSRRHYVIGCAVLIVGIVLFVGYLHLRAGALPHIQIVVPGTHEIYLAKPGKYTVFYEYRSVIDNKIYATGESLPDMLTMLKSKESSREVVLSKPSRHEAYEERGRAGASALEFEIEEAGTYIFTADHTSGLSEPEVVFAIGQSKILGMILIGLGIIFGSLIIGGFIIVRAFLKRHEVEKQVVKGSWFQRHLNWTLVLSWIAATPLWFSLSGLFHYVYDSISAEMTLDATLLGTILISLFVAALVLVVTVWYLNEKNRSALHLLWYLIFSIGSIILLSLENRSEKT